LPEPPLPALAAAETNYALRNSGDDPEWVYWLNEDEIEIMAARCLVKLKQPKEAIERLSKVIDRYDPGKTREMALYTSWLSEAHILARNIDQAVYHASRSAELAALTTSTRSDDRIRALVAKLSPFAQSAAVKDFMAKARAPDRRGPYALSGQRIWASGPRPQKFVMLAAF
jgi:hypothetical protein